MITHMSSHMVSLHVFSAQWFQQVSYIPAKMSLLLLVIMLMFDSDQSWFQWCCGVIVVGVIVMGGGDSCGGDSGGGDSGGGDSDGGVIVVEGDSGGGDSGGR